MTSSWITLCLLTLSASALAALVPLYLVPVIIKRGKAWGIMDIPGPRKMHSRPTPRLGGLTIIPALWLGTSLALILATHFPSEALSHDSKHFSLALIGLLIGASGTFILGCLDDFRGLAASQKLMFQLLIAALALPFLGTPSSLFGIEISPLVGGLITFGWLVILPNSVNLLDGLDGLASTLAIAFIIVVSSLSVLQGQTGWLLVLLPFLVAILSFLRFNWKPAKIFLGDSGSLLLGFIVAYTSLHFSYFKTSDGFMDWNPAISVALTSVWLFDTALAIFRRYRSKRPTLDVFMRSKRLYLRLHKRAISNVVRPDRMHLHHRLEASGFTIRQTVTLISTGSFAAMVLSIPLTAIGSSTSNPLLMIPVAISAATVIVLKVLSDLWTAHLAATAEQDDDQIVAAG